MNNDLNEFDRLKRLADAAGEKRLNANIQKNIQVLDKKFETEKRITKFFNSIKTIK